LADRHFRRFWQLGQGTSDVPAAFVRPGATILRSGVGIGPGKAVFPGVSVCQTGDFGRFGIWTGGIAV